MIPTDGEMLHCIVDNGQISDGFNGLAIGCTELAAWERLLNPCNDQTIAEAKQWGHEARRCGIMVVNL